MCGPAEAVWWDDNNPAMQVHWELGAELVGVEMSGDDTSLFPTILCLLACSQSILSRPLPQTNL